MVNHSIPHMSEWVIPVKDVDFFGKLAENSVFQSPCCYRSNYPLLSTDHLTNSVTESMRLQMLANAGFVGMLNYRIHQIYTIFLDDHRPLLNTLCVLIHIVPVAVCDGAGSWNRGLAYEGRIKHRMGGPEVVDQVRVRSRPDASLSQCASETVFTGFKRLY